MSATTRILKSLREEKGATALEFAILSPVFMLIVVGGVNLGLLLYAAGSLHFAVEDAARCASVRTTVCTNATTTQSYASSHYYGPSISPTFTYTSTTCGNSVTGSGTFGFHVGVANYSVPLSATACFP
jgi:Flp pilus assembly protein TadG